MATKARIVRKKKSSRKTPNLGSEVAISISRRAKPIPGSKNQMKALTELKKVTKEINKRFTFSEKLFEKKQKLKEQLGID